MSGFRSIPAILLGLWVLDPCPAAAQTVPVTTVEELYDAVNNPANAATLVVLGPGTYRLSAADPNNAPRPKGGRLELQADMSLRGVEGDSSAVVIDASALPASSYPQTVNGVATGPNAAVRMGLGRNALEWLTVRDARFAQANIDTGLQPLDPWTTFVRIAHVISIGSTRGLNVLNFGPQTSGQTIEAEIVDSEFVDNVLNLSEGIRLGNFQGARGSTVNVRMTGNVSRGQKQGRLIVNNRAIASTINVVSSGNQFFDNGGGTIIVGGLSSNNTRADGNVINVDIRGDRFIGNTRVSEFDRGGLVVLGSENISDTAGGASNNTVRVRLWGSRTTDNAGDDLVAIGARWVFLGTAGLSENNHVSVAIQGGGNERNGLTPFVAATVPDGASYGNTASVTTDR